MMAPRFDYAPGTREWRIHTFLRLLHELTDEPKGSAEAEAIKRSGITDEDFESMAIDEAWEEICLGNPVIH